MRRINIVQNIALNAYWIGLSIKWNSIHILILPAILLAYVPEGLKSTYLGILTFTGMIIAMVVQPVAGAISDGWQSRWGRRRPMIILGTLCEFIFLAFLGWAGGLLWLIIGYLGLQFASNVAHGPAQGLMPDIVPQDQLGFASGVKNLMDMVGVIIASQLMGITMKPGDSRAILPILLVAAVVALGTAVTALSTKEEPTNRKVKAPSLHTRLSTLRQTFHIDFRGNTSYWWLISSRFFYLLGINGIQGFAQYYVRDVFQSANPVKLTGDLLAAITLPLILFVVLGGSWGDRYGHRKLLAASGMISSVGCVLLFAARTPALLLVFGSVLGSGVGLFLTSNWTLANQLAPAKEAGKYLGLTNIATAGSGALSRLTGPIIDLLNNLSPGDFFGYLFLFGSGAVFTLLSISLLLKVRKLPVVPAPAVIS